MLKISNILIGFGLLFCSMVFADMQVSIGINIPVYPQLVVVPGYPVYYAPQLESNYFFYDGLYWVFQDDIWYESSWYDGPWWFVDPEDVPLFILRVPVRYYRQPPTFFFGWNSISPPRWGDHWGHDWDRRRSGWDRWDRRAPHSPAPLPNYQQQYSGDRYPRQVEQQHELQKKSYNYEPHNPMVRQHYQQQEERIPVQQINPQRENPQQERQRASEEKGARQRNGQYSVPNQPGAPSQQGRAETQRSQSQQNGEVVIQKSSPPPSQQEHQQTQESRQRSDKREDQRSQSQQKGDVGAQRSSQPSPQQEPQQTQEPMQRSQQRLDPQSQQRNIQREQQDIKLQSQGKKQQSNDGSNERNQDHGQMRDRGHNE